MTYTLKVSCNSWRTYFLDILLKTLPSPQYNEHSVNGVSWYTTDYEVKICDFGLSRIKIAETGEVIYNTVDTFTEVFQESKDIMKLGDELRKLKLVEQETMTIEQKNIYKDLKRKITQGKQLKELLTHKFFDPLKEVPKHEQLQLEDESSKENLALVQQLENLTIAPTKPKKEIQSRTGRRKQRV